MHSDDILGKEKIWKLALIMGVPSILAQLVNLLYNIVDRMYIGNMAGMGNEALAGLSICAPIITFISAFSSFVSGGGAPLAARSLGAQNREKASRYLGNGFLMLIVFSVFLSIIAFVFEDNLLLATGGSDITIPLAKDYLNIYLLGTIAVSISVGLNTFITAQGKSKLAMCSVLIGAVLNIGLDPLFIFKFNMGIKGAAIATIISQFSSAIFVLTVLFNKRTSLRLEFKYMVPKSSIILDTLRVGVAPFIMASTEAVIGFVLNGRLKHYGGDIYVSALAILQSVMMLITVPISGFTQGITPILSYNYGASNKNRLKRCYFLTLICCFTYCSLFSAIMMLFPHMFGMMFTKSIDLLAITDKYMKGFVFGMLIFGVQRACQTTFVAMGESIFSLFIAVLRKIILLVPFAIIFPRFVGVGGVFYAEGVADTIAACLCGTIFFFRFRVILNRMEEKDTIVNDALIDV